MPTITLTETQQAALCALMSLEPTPGCPLPSAETLRLIEVLVRGDATGVGDDVALLMLVMPVLQRLARVRPPQQLPAALTVQERRVLMLVANGLSNAEIASHLFVSVATVRKHLENSYRKLGVHNRLAAVVAFEGGPIAHPGRVEQAELAEKYA